MTSPAATASPSPGLTMILRLAVLLTVSLTALAPLQAQRDKKLPRWRIDPYTRNEPGGLERFGYTSYGPFEFGQRGAEPTTTADIDAHFDDDCQILWVETPHYRIGSSLEAWAVPMDPKVKAKVRAELEAMKERTGIKKINPKSRKLDPWLRLHLFAQRLEDHYAEVSRLLGVTDDDFPADDDDRKARTGKYMGEGPYLGQKNKYLFLLFEETDHYNDYLASFTGRRTIGGQQWNFMKVDSLLYACSADNPSEDGRLRNDLAMHAHVIHANTHSLLNGYLHYNYNMPVWIREGLAHWFERQVTPKFNSYTRGEGAPPLKNAQWRFELEARKLAASGKFVPMAEAMNWRDFGQMDFDAHVSLWSRWDYLRTLGDDKFAAFLRGAKGQIDPLTGALNGDVLGGTRDALREHYKMTPLVLDERWKEWALETYPAK